jgi:cellulose synthase/poly-beta-1,6-N-acetylglucosamine synthase-like glycosyltransferase
MFIFVLICLLVVAILAIEYGKPNTIDFFVDKTDYINKENIEVKDLRTLIYDICRGWVIIIIGYVFCFFLSFLAMILIICSPKWSYRISGFLLVIFLGMFIGIASANMANAEDKFQRNIYLIIDIILGLALAFVAYATVVFWKRVKLIYLLMNYG